MQQTNPLIEERKKKIETLSELGIEAFAVSFEKTHSALDAEEQEARELPEIEEDPKNNLAIAGRLMTFREHGRICFGTLQDESGKIQVCFMRGHTEVTDCNNPEKQEYVWKKLLDLGDFIGVRGDLFVTKHGQKTILIKEISLLSKSIRPLPEKFHGLTDRETCYRERNLDLTMNRETFERFRFRSRMIREIRSFFEEKHFEEVETRVLQPQAGGAMAKVFETHHNALDHDFVLRIALELDLKTAIGGGFERLFEVGKNFRNEGIDPSHLQEFTMCEWYAAYEHIETNKRWTEELFHRICEGCIGSSTITILDPEGQEVTIDFSQKFAEARFPDLLQKHAGLDMFTASDLEVQQKARELGVEKIEGVGRANLLDDIYKKTAREKLIEPTFVFDYPEELKPLARPNGDGTANCFQLVISGWEVVNSYGELINPLVQRRLLEEQAAAKQGGDEEAMDIDETFLKAMEHGFPPMTGSGFGIDRLVALLTAQPNLRDVVLFPTMKPEKQLQISNDELQMKGGVGAVPCARPASDSQEIGARKSNADILNTDEHQKKFFVILNKKIEPGKLMNALAHMALSISAFVPEAKNLLEYVDADGDFHGNISHHAVIVLRADNSNKLRTTKKAAQEADIEYADFTSSMTVGASADQVQATAEGKDEELEYFGLMLFGEVEKIQPITKKFSLWK